MDVSRIADERQLSYLSVRMACGSHLVAHIYSTVRLMLGTISNRISADHCTGELPIRQNLDYNELSNCSVKLAVSHEINHKEQYVRFNAPSNAS